MQGDLSPEKQLVERIRTLAGGGNDKEIAPELGVSAASISHWKRGEGPGKKKLKQIAEKYNVTLDYLLHGDETDKSNSEKKDNSSPETALTPMTRGRFIAELQSFGVEDFHSIKSMEGLSPTDMEEIIAVVKNNAKTTAQMMIELRTKSKNR